MDAHERQERKREARRRLSDQRRRAGLLRGRVIAVSILCFGLLWAVVFVQMATGNDPVLSDRSQAKTTAKSTTTTRQARESETESATEPEAVTVEPTPETELEVEPAPEVEAEPEFEAAEVEPEFEPEPLTTGQS